jgi:23S rRNA (pseudouridine1915-N3)-methyltransferase
MKIYLVAVGNRMPQWVDSAYREYATRFPRQCHLQLIEVASQKRTKSSDPSRVRELESSALLSAVPKNCHRVVLERSGRDYSTEQLAQRLQQWMGEGRDVALLIGGPDGLSPACLEQLDDRWSLSALTFAHPLVRVIVAEQLYRAWSIINNLPYHRGHAN